MGSKTIIESIILYVATERFNMITEDLIFKASYEYESVWKNVKPLKPNVRVDEDKITKFLIAVGNSLVTNNWIVPLRLYVEAEKNYKILRKIVSIDVIKPFTIDTDEEPGPTHDRRIPKLNFTQPQELGVKITAHVDSAESRDVSDKLTKPSEGVVKIRIDKRKIEKLDNEALEWKNPVEPQNLEVLFSNKQCSLEPLCKTREIVDELGRIYKREWRAAFEHCRLVNGNADTMKFLREILRESYDKVCLPIAETQIILMQREALKIVKGTYRMMHVEFPDPAFLMDYRRNYATLSLSYVKQAFFEKHLERLVQKYKIVYKNLPVDKEAVNLFAAKCVEVTWFMVIHDPRMMLDFENKGQMDDKDLFRPYFEDGETLTTVVWPAVRQLEGGRILDDGIAIFY